MYAMEAIYANNECVKPDNPTPSTNYTGQRSSRRSFYLGVILSLSLLTVLLLVGRITLSFFYHNSAEHVSAQAEKRDLLNKNISAVSNQLSSMTEERDLLTKKTEELKKQIIQCPAGWSSFSCSCYLLSGSSDSWDAARRDCRDRGADLVVIEFAKEQEYLTRLTKTPTWIGLHDEEEEGKWKWVDGNPVNLKYWADGQPDNGGGDPQWGEEDCAQIRTFDNTLWNDYSCRNSLPWVCEKIP
ncbi:CD209 antigen-like protein E [Simochromis diagramma]|uniref:CD209 antigen-like protein E n=1 Tax=Simochromis diagramma TaxID=43689 RepID=UPI001A7EDA74|nr:CD209 antigen-like protein E [Simochromis diagramma]